jgi:hypothetical protein
VFVPTAAARKLHDERVDGFLFDELLSGLVIASTAPSPFAMGADEMNRLARYLLPAIGTKNENDALKT